MKRVEEGDWTEFRRLPASIEVDFHYSECGRRCIPYWEAMEQISAEALDALRKAHEIGLKYVLFTHGHSTSGPGRTTARSQVRKLIRSKAATPHVKRKECIQHPSCFVAAIRENQLAKPPRLLCPKCQSTTVERKSWPGHFRCRQCRHEFSWFDLET